MNCRFQIFTFISQHLLPAWSTGGVLWSRQASSSYSELLDMVVLLCLNLSTCSSVFTVQTDLPSMTSIKLCLKLRGCEPPIEHAMDSQKLVIWRCCGSEPATPLLVRVSTSFWVPCDGEGNWTQTPWLSVLGNLTFFKLLYLCTVSSGHRTWGAWISNKKNNSVLKCLTSSVNIVKSPDNGLKNFLFVFLKKCSIYTYLKVICVKWW